MISDPPYDYTMIEGQLVECYKYLDNKLSFESNTDVVYKESQQCLYCLRKQSKFQVARTLMTHFLFYLLVAISQGQTNKILNKVVNVCSKITGTVQVPLQDLYNKHLITKTIKALRECRPPPSSSFTGAHAARILQKRPGSRW